MKLLLARTMLAGSILGLSGCAAFDWWPQSTANAGGKPGEQSSSNTAGGPETFPRIPDVGPGGAGQTAPAGPDIQTNTTSVEHKQTLHRAASPFLKAKGEGA